MTVGLFALYILIISYIRTVVGTNSFTTFIVIMTGIFTMLLGVFWLRERNLYYDYIMQRRIEEGQVEYMLCPNCKSVQIKGMRQCSICREVWLTCRACHIPFEPGSHVLIAPCCGEGFHYDHFEVALRETGLCPHCGSDMALKTTNW